MVQISLNIPEEVKNGIKLAGFGYAGVFMRGYEVIKNQNSQEKEMEELKKRLEKVVNKLNFYVARCVELEDSVTSMENQLKGVKDVLEKKRKPQI